MKKWSLDMLEAFSACDENAVLSLIRLGFPTETPISLRDQSGQNVVNKTFCVHLACEYGFIEGLKELILRGCNLESLDSFMRTPLMVACEAGNLEIVKYLILTCKVSVRSHDFVGNTIVHIASVNGKIEVLKFLIEELGIFMKPLNSSRKTPLSLCRELYAIDYNPKIEKVLAYLLMKQNQLNYVEPEAYDGIHISTGNCHENCIKSYKNLGNSVGSRKIRVRSNGNIEEFIFRRVPGGRHQKSKVFMHNALSVDKLVSLKCDQIYKKILNENALIPIKQTRLRAPASIFSTPSTSIIPSVKSNVSTKTE